MLKSIFAVTLTAPDLHAIEQAYVEWLGYRVTTRGHLNAQQAAQLGAPAAAGSRYLLMQAASGSGACLRVIERPATAGYGTLRHHGWNANEILVEDPAALAARFADPASPFRVVGEPAPLETSPSVIAMQAIGPAGEMNYFTRIPPGGGTFIKTSASSFVDRTFIMVLGGPSLSAMKSFYQSLGASVTESYSAQVALLQQALSLPADAVTMTALVTISPASLVELDEVPAQASERPRRIDDLPPGFAIVSFGIDSLDTVALPWKIAPQPRDEAPYHGRRSALLEGAAGEWIELIETG